jgi:hypothetical protein
MDRWKQGKLTLLRGNQEVAPGIQVIAAHDTHTLGSQYVVVDDGRDGRWVMAGDNVYVYENLEGLNHDGHFVPIGLVFGSVHQCMLTMEEMFQTVNGDVTHVLPFHEVHLWDRFPTRRYSDELHVADISLRTVDKTRLQGVAEQ